MYANEFETKEKQKLTEIKNKLQHMQTWTYLCILVVYYTPMKQKPKKVGNKLGKFTFFYYYCVSLDSLARQCLWSLPGEVLLKSLPQNAKPVHMSPTGPFCLKGGYITTIPWINYSTDS